MKYYIYENTNTKLLEPFSINHASFELRCGAFSNIQRVMMQMEPDSELVLIVRNGIEALIKDRFPGLTVNPNTLSAGYYIDGSALISSKDDIKELYIEKIKENISYSDGKFSSELNNKGASSNLKYISYLWDIFDFQPSIIDYDLIYFRDKKNDNTIYSNKNISLINKSSIYIADSAQVCSGAIIDASTGPVIIDSCVFVDIGVLIKGPAYIGKGTILNPGLKIRGNFSAGMKSKVGGEVEDSVIQGYSNKQHDGYLGHSYIGEWVNIGAGTSTSDLKNNYSSIRYLYNNDNMIDTNRTFLGSMIGDYSSLGIMSMLNSGTNIGFGSNIFGSGFQDKYVKPFSWGHEDKVGYNRFINSIKKIKLRRDETLSDVEKNFILDIYSKS